MLKRKVKAIEKILISLLLAANSFICVFALDDTSSTTEQPVQQETQQETSETQNEVQEAQQNQEYTYSDDSVSVTVTAPVDALPADAILHADKIDNSEVDVLSESDVLDDTIQNSVIYDVYFTFNDEEIEPTQPVQVSMNLKIADIDSNMDTSTVNVKHIKDNNEVNTVADTNGVGEITSDGESLNASFTTESFSYFVICYGKNNNNEPNNPLYAYLCYKNGEGGYSEIPNSLGKDDHLTITGSNKTYDQADFTKYNTKENTWVHMETLVATYGKYTQGYTYQSSHAVSENGPGINWIYYQASTGNWYISNSSNDQRPNDNLNQNENNISVLSKDSKIYCLFSKDHLANSAIQDNVATDGSLFLPRPEGIKPGSLVTYKWYRNTTDVETSTETFEYVPRTKVTGSSYSIESDNSGTRLYPALDMGVTEAYKKNEEVRYWYKVEVYENHKLYMTTEPIHNMYYACLQNGSFEYPDTQKLNAEKAGAFIPDGTANLNWHTTGEDKQLEIVYAPYANSPGGYNISDGKAPDGNQCAELNAEAAGTLYQDIMSTPNTKLYWKLSHRGRQGQDTMYLLVAQKNLVENTIITQKNVNDLIREIREKPEHYENLGYYLQAITDDTSGWDSNNEYHSYNGYYEVPEGSYLTRMFFAAGETASKNDTVGNFIDDVSFSPLLPPPDPGNANIEVSKTVTGISEKDIRDANNSYRISVDVAIDGGSTVKTITFDFKKSTKIADRTYKMTSSITVPAGKKYKITENVLTNVGDAYTSPKDGKKYIINKGEEKDYDGNNGIVCSVNENDNLSIELINQYHPKTVSLTVTNKVFGNMGSKEKEFTYYLKYPDGTGKDHKEEFKLKSDEPKTFLIPYGTIVYVEQESESDDGYSSYYIVGEDGTSVITSLIFHDENNPLTSDVTVNYFNTRNMTVPTVVKSNSGYLLGVIVFGLIGLLSIVFRVKMK